MNVCNGHIATNEADLSINMDRVRKWYRGVYSVFNEIINEFGSITSYN
jgi:hypothetical protein